MAQWSAIRLQPYRGQLALNELARAALRDLRTANPSAPLCERQEDRDDAASFPRLYLHPQRAGHVARFTPGVVGLIMDGKKPARVPDIDELKGRERNGIIALPKSRC